MRVAIAGERVHNIIDLSIIQHRTCAIPFLIPAREVIEAWYSDKA
jgi:hypothetical protein